MHSCELCVYFNLSLSLTQMVPRMFAIQFGSIHQNEHIPLRAEFVAIVVEKVRVRVRGIM